MNEELITHENEENKLEESIQSNEENIKDFSKNIENFKMQVEEIDKGKEKIENISNKLFSEKEKREKIFQKFQESNQIYLNYQMILKSDTEKMEEFKRQSLSLDKESSELIAKRNSLDLKLPNLENEKQTMVKARNFKVLYFF